MRLRANKSGLVKLLRARGCDIPSLRCAGFEALWQGMALSWADQSGKCRTAYLYGGTASPCLQIGSSVEPVTVDELSRFGLIEPEAQKRSPDSAEADIEAHKDNMMIPQFAALCKG